MTSARPDPDGRDDGVPVSGGEHDGTVPGPEPSAAPPEGPEEPTHRLAEVVDPTTVRRAPRYGRFVLVGVLAGALAALVLTLLPIGGSDLGAGVALVLLLLVLGFAGALGGAVVALVLDRRSLRRRQGR